MPELPEVEALRRQLKPALVGQVVKAVNIRRRDVITDPAGGRITPAKLLQGRAIAKVARHGKNLFLIAETNHHDVTDRETSTDAVRIHLGMTGNLRLNAQPLPPHSHIVWTLHDGTTLTFSDPRRFGHLWPWPGNTKPDNLGPDALTITTETLHHSLQRTQRAMKVVLLDQRILAGLGNIYVDELLFTIGVHPLRPACELNREQVSRLIRAMRRMLRQAIAAGGSTLRDYRSATGDSGTFVSKHRIYGKYGQNCPICSGKLLRLIIAGRSSTVCPQCQPLD